MSWNIERAKLPINNYDEDECVQNFQSIESLINFKDGEEPDFYDMVMSDTHLTKTSKNKFIKSFWNIYKKSENIDFRKSVIGKYLFWLNKKFIGVIDNLNDTDNYGKNSDDKFLIQISDTYESSFLSCTIKNYINDFSKSNILDVFRVNIIISNKKNPEISDSIFTRKMIIDTGATISDLPVCDYWNFSKLKFEEYPPDWPFTLKYKEPQIVEWNNNIKNCVKVKLLTANGKTYTHKLFFNYPLYIKIGDLQPIEMYSFNIPIEKPKTFNNLLLGLDYLHNIKLTMEPAVVDNMILLKLEDW